MKKNKKLFAGKTFFYSFVPVLTKHTMMNKKLTLYECIFAMHDLSIPA